MTGHTRLVLASLWASLLAATALIPVYADRSWMGGAVIGMLLVVGVAEGADRLRLPLFAGPLLGLVTLVLYLTGVFFARHATLGFIPSFATWHEAHSFVTAIGKDIRSYATPVPPLRELELIASGGVALVALLVHTLAVVARRAVLAGLPLLLLYIVPAAVVNGGVDWRWFALGAVGYLLLLLADSRDRVARWGRPLTFATTGRVHTSARDVPTSPLARTGRRVGMAAVGVAVLLPVVVPGLEGSLLRTGTGVNGAGGHGRSAVEVENPILTVAGSLNQGKNTPVITYTTSSDSPGYLRIATLDSFDGASWAPSALTVKKNQKVTSGLPSAPGLGTGLARQTVTSKVAIGDLDGKWLPLFYPSTKVAIHGTWLYDSATFNVFTTDTSLRGQRYTVTSQEIAPTDDQLANAGSPPSSVQKYLEVPGNVPPVVISDARLETQAATTAYQRALLLQAWFRTAFTYDTTVPGQSTGNDAIQAFLTTKHGFCVQFATTMALMSRILGIPARVDVGFTQGSHQPDGSWLIQSHDAHAWPELYFQGVGWVPFEPTPGGANVRTPSYSVAAPTSKATGPAGPSGTSSAPAGGPSGTSSAGGDPHANNHRGDSFPAASVVPPVPLVHHPVPWRAIGGLAVLLVVLVTPWLTRTIVRRRRWDRADSALAIAGAAWAELRDDLGDHGLEWTPSQTPRQTSTRLVRELSMSGAAAESLRRIATAVERAQYARESDDVTGLVQQLRADVGVVRGHLREFVERPTRLRAMLFPRSAVRLLTLDPSAVRRQRTGRTWRRRPA